MRKIDLTGEWRVHPSGSKRALTAHVPGCVHADLLAAREIGNPALGRTLEQVAWVSETSWTFEKDFALEDLSDFDRVVLRFEGIDSRAEIWLNEIRLGRSDNMFEAVEFDARDALRSGRNRLNVECRAGDPREGVRTQASVRGLAGRPVSPGAGLWRGVSLLAFKGVRIRDMLIRQDFSVAGCVGLNVALNLEYYQLSRPLEAVVRVCYKGSILHEARELLHGAEALLRLTIRNPQLWWPAGLGEQPLYEVTCDVLEGRSSLDHVSRRIGLRQFTFEASPSDAVARVLVNRQPLFLKGASWLPADLYVARLTRVEYARLVKAAALAHMNVLRVWGGGVYESDAFYDLCDEYGVCVWQDLMLSAAQSEPPGPTTLASFAREVEHQARRLRHHPGLMLWSGGDNGGCGVAPEYQRAAADVLAALDPDRQLLPATPHLPLSLGRGAASDSEPLPGFPEPRVFASALSDESERNLAHPACACRVTPADGVKRVFQGFLDRFLLPSGFDNTIWLSQIQQAFALQRQYEHARLSVADAPGFVFWHLNDCWLAGSPATLDDEGRWKAAHYQVRRFFQPLWVCGRFQADMGRLEIGCFNDGLRPFSGELQWRVVHMDGAIVSEGARKVTAPAAGRDRQGNVRVADLLRRHGAANLAAWVYLLDEQGNQVAWNSVLFCEPRDLALQPPRMRAEIRAWDDSSFSVTLTSHRPAMWVWLSLEGLEARYDENFFCLEPEKPFRVRVTPVERIKLDPFRQAIRIGSLRDTWQEKRNLMQVMPTAARRQAGEGLTNAGEPGRQRRAGQA